MGRGLVDYYLKSGKSSQQSKWEMDMSLPFFLYCESTLKVMHLLQEVTLLCCKNSHVGRRQLARVSHSYAVLPLLHQPSPENATMEWLGSLLRIPLLKNKQGFSESDPHSTVKQGSMWAEWERKVGIRLAHSGTRCWRVCRLLRWKNDRHAEHQ